MPASQILLTRARLLSLAVRLRRGVPAGVYLMGIATGYLALCFYAYLVAGH